MLATVPTIPSIRLSEEFIVEFACLILSCASVSTGAPGLAATGFVADCQPSCGVSIVVIVFACACIAPIVVQVAVAVTVPLLGITTDAPSCH